MLFERKEMLCKENDGSTPSTTEDWADIDLPEEGEDNMWQDFN
jgi:hypothetical protein